MIHEGALDPDDGFSEATPIGLSHPRKRAMVAALARTCNVSAFVRAAGISHATYYPWLEHDEDYAKAVVEAMEDAADVLEAAARRRATRAMEYSSRPGENVLDLFGGSGSTLIGAEMTGRKAFLMEIDPAYCDVIRKRWAEFVRGEGCEWAVATPVAS